MTDGICKQASCSSKCSALPPVATWPSTACTLVVLWLLSLCVTMLEVSQRKIEWHLEHRETNTVASPCHELSPRKLIGTPHDAACSVKQYMYCSSLTKDTTPLPFRLHDGDGTT